MRRREFIKVIAVASAAAWPLAAHAQQSAMPVIGFLHAGSLQPNAAFVAAFRKGLSDMGLVEDQNVRMEYRWAEGHSDRLPEMAADLVRRRVAVIAAPLSTQAALAAKAATTTIPIVFGSGGDPVAMGLVDSLSRPSGNVTGVAFMGGQLGAKRLGLLHDVLPAAAHFAVLGATHHPLTEATVKDVQESAGALGIRVDALYASMDSEIETAFATMTQNQVDALLIAPDELFTSRIRQLAVISLRYRMPASYPISEFAKAGGLVSYGPDFANAYQETGRYTGRVVKGEKPAELPVEQPTKFEFVINLKTAKALGLTIPQPIALLADEVIE